MRLLRTRFCLPALLVILLALPSQASAAANHPFLGAITGGYEDACGVGFGPGGLYVSDYYHDAIDGPTSILSEDPHGGPCKLAFDSAGDLYVNNWHHDVVRYVEPFTAGTGTVIDAAQPTGLAVDQASGDVYVTHRTYVAEYDPSGALIATVGAENLAQYYGAAVSEFPATAGYIYVPDASDDTVKVFDPATSLTEPVEEMTGVATPQGGFIYLTDAEVAVDNTPGSPSYGHVFVLDAVGHGLSEHPEALLDEFNAEGAYRGQITGFTDAEPSGIAFEASTHDVYVTSGNSEGSAVFIYGPTAPAKTLTVAKSGAGAGVVTSRPSGIDCGSACVAEYDEGQTVTLLAAPDGGSAFAGWTVTGLGAEPCPGLGSCTVQMSAAREVSAKFEEAPSLAVAETGAGEATVGSRPAGAACPGACPEQSAAAQPPASAAADLAPLQLISAPTRGSTAIVELRLSRPGTLTLAGPDLRARKVALAAGASRLRLRLDRRGARLLAGHRHLAARLTLRFLPASGAVATRTVELRFAQGKPRDFDRKGR
jgi:DNA-binding beta-propeller fold protein YncE